MKAAAAQYQYILGHVHYFKLSSIFIFKNSKERGKIYSSLIQYLENIILTFSDKHINY